MSLNFGDRHGQYRPSPLTHFFQVDRGLHLYAFLTFPEASPRL
ncbi:hypothetical protein [Picosynechococcus sp. PCC 8807]|nr:hypothetical protein [Picosynechococcus sp. PCC 8807]